MCVLLQLFSLLLCLVSLMHVWRYLYLDREPALVFFVTPLIQAGSFVSTPFCQPLAQLVLLFHCVASFLTVSYYDVLYCIGSLCLLNV